MFYEFELLKNDKNYIENINIIDYQEIIDGGHVGNLFDDGESNFLDTMVDIVIVVGIVYIFITICKKILSLIKKKISKDNTDENI